METFIQDALEQSTEISYITFLIPIHDHDAQAIGKYKTLVELTKCLFGDPALTTRTPLSLVTACSTELYNYIGLYPWCKISYENKGGRAHLASPSVIWYLYYIYPFSIS